MTARRRRLTRRIAAAPARPAGRRGWLRSPWRRRRTRTADQTAARRRTAARYRRLGGPSGQRRPHAARSLTSPRPQPIELSTATAEAIYPFLVASAAAQTDRRGAVIGVSPTGGTFCFDPFTAYRDGRLTNPNLLILGDVGSGKSTLAKTLVWRGLEFGRGAHIIDPKGEYAPLAAAAGTQPIALTPGGQVTLNPLDLGAARHRLPPAGLFHRNLATVRALLEATLGRDCRQLELVLASSCLARVCSLELDPAVPAPTGYGQTATLPMLADALVDPPADIAHRLHIDPARLTAESREMALALARLVDDHGDLAGMFAGHTSIDADALGDCTVVDLSAVHTTHRSLLPLVMVCTAAWLQVATAASPRGRFQVNDEAWALLADEPTARWMQTNQKLSRQLALSVVNVLHRLSDTAAAGDAGSTTRSLADGVIADCGTWIIYRQKPAEAPRLQTTLGLNRLQTGLTARLPRGRGLWIEAGETRHVTLVDHLITPTEQALCDTDAPLRAVDPDPHPVPDPRR